MNRRRFLETAAAAGASLAVIGSGPFSQAARVKPLRKKPNVIFILADDMGYETAGFNGAVNYKTPNLDEMAKESYVFTQCDSQPLCCPTRVKLVSGQYNYRSYHGWGGFAQELPSIGEIMQENGYETAVFGKWHINTPPDELGFDQHCIFTAHNDGLSQADHMKYYYYDSPIFEEGVSKKVPYAPDKFNKRVLDFIEEKRDKPFFIYYPFSLAHNPFEPTPDSEDQRSIDWQRNFEDMVVYLDKLIGNVVNKLKAEGLYEDTIIFYTADNGTKTKIHKMKDGRTVYGAKGTHAHDGVHVPLLVKYDGTAKTCDDLVDFCDFYPTITSIAGIKDQHEDIDGVSLAPIFENKTRDGKPYIFSLYTHPLSAYVRDQRYKLFYDQRLFDLEYDPHEEMPYYINNDTPETAKARQAMSQYMMDLIDGRLSKYRHRKEALVNTFGDLKYPRDNNWMIAGQIFDGYGFVPEPKTVRYDITHFLKEAESDYSVSFARYYRSGNSGLIYSDVAVKSIQIVQDGKTVISQECDNVELTTRRDVKALRELGDEYTTFDYQGDNVEVPVGKLSKAGKTELVINAAFSNPANQFGDRVKFYVFLNRTN